MTDDRYTKIYEDFGRDLLAVAKKHGKRALREAVRDAAKDELGQGDRIGEDKREQSSDDIPPEELDYPEEDVWTVPPADEDPDEPELSDAAEKVLADIMDKLEERAGK